MLINSSVSRVFAMASTADLSHRMSHSIGSEVLEMTLLSLLLILVGAPLAFNIKGFIGKSHEENAEFIPLNRGWRGIAASATLPSNPYRRVGLIFFLAGTALLALVVIGLIVLIIRSV